jgi:hypothetical protein
MDLKEYKRMTVEFEVGGETFKLTIEPPPKEWIEDFTREYPSIKDRENVFWRNGEYWFVKFKNKSTLLPDLDGIRYIVVLLQQTKTSVHVNDLMRSLKGYSQLDKKNAELAARYSQMSDEELEKEGLARELQAEDMTEEEKRRLEDSIQIFHEEYMEAGLEDNREKVGEAEQKWKNTERHMLNEHAIKIYSDKKGKLIFKHLKRPTEDIDKVRVAVKKNIDKAVKLIKKEIKPLGDHLKNYLHTGTSCIYDPDPDLKIEWYIIP